MKFGLFSELYDEAKSCENVDVFIERREDDVELKKTPDDNIVLLLRFIYDAAHMGIRDIREYLGMLRPQFSVLLKHTDKKCTVRVSVGESVILAVLV